MDLDWGTAIQALILAACTWYMRRGSKADARKVAQSTASQTTSDEILARVVALEVDVSLVKRATLKETGIDNRGPARK